MRQKRHGGGQQQPRKGRKDEIWAIKIFRIATELDWVIHKLSKRLDIFAAVVLEV